MLHLNKIADNLLPDIIEKLGYLINPLVLNFKTEKNQLLIFCFHGLFNSIKQKNLNHIDPQNNMTTSQFVEFLDYFLSKHYKFISIQDLKKGLNPDQAYAIITFDDGYFNNILAVNLLNKYNIPFVIFISTKNITENSSYWWDIVYKYRNKQGNSLEAIRKEQRFLKKFKYTYINKYIIDNFGINSFKPWSDIDRPFKTQEIQNLSKNRYVTFGNHTHNHSILTRYTKKEIKEELNVSNNIIFELTGKLPSSIAFPNGNYNKLVLNSVEEAGFKFAFTTEPNINYLPIRNDKLICLNRYMTTTEKISKTASFWRLGYEPYLLYRDMKKQIKLMIKNDNLNTNLSSKDELNS